MHGEGKGGDDADEGGEDEWSAIEDDDSLLAASKAGLLEPLQDLGGPPAENEARRRARTLRLQRALDARDEYDPRDGRDRRARQLALLQRRVTAVRVYREPDPWDAAHADLLQPSKPQDAVRAGEAATVGGRGEPETKRGDSDGDRDREPTNGNGNAVADAPFNPHKLHIPPVTKSALSNPALLRLLVPPPTWGLSSAADPVRPGRRVSHLPLSTRFQDARDRVRERAQRAVEASALGHGHGRGVLGTPAERFEAVVFAYQDLVRLLFCFRRFRHRAHYLPKMLALLLRTTQYKRARALLAWKRQWLKALKANFSSEERAWKGFVGKTVTGRVKAAFRHLRRHVSVMRNERLDDFKLAQRIRSNPLCQRAFNRIVFPTLTQCFEALFDHSNQTGSTTEERARADHHFSSHRQRRFLRRWHRWSDAQADQRWPPAMHSDEPHTRSRIWTTSALPGVNIALNPETPHRQGSDLIRKLYGSDASDRLTRDRPRTMSRRRRQCISMMHGISEDARLRCAFAPPGYAPAALSSVHIQPPPQTSSQVRLCPAWVWAIMPRCSVVRSLPATPTPLPLQGTPLTRLEMRCACVRSLTSRHPKPLPRQPRHTRLARIRARLAGVFFARGFPAGRTRYRAATLRRPGSGSHGIVRAIRRGGGGRLRLDVPTQRAQPPRAAGGARGAAVR